MVSKKILRSTLNINKTDKSITSVSMSVFGFKIHIKKNYRLLQKQNVILHLVVCTITVNLIDSPCVCGASLRSFSLSSLRAVEL